MKYQHKEYAMTQSNGHAPEESIIKFPCDFTVKIMGKSAGDFEKIAVDIVKKHFPKTDNSCIQKKFSKDNNFLSLSITVHAQSKMQLDALYQELTNTKEVLMAL
jgi:putative lipoic acid-binding regulatory protein